MTKVFNDLSEVRATTELLEWYYRQKLSTRSRRFHYIFHRKIKKCYLGLFKKQKKENIKCT